MSVPASGLTISPVASERFAIAGLAVTSRAAPLAWLVPGLVLGLPGALLIIIVVAQVAGAATFLGLTRRVMGSVGLLHRS